MFDEAKQGQIAYPVRKFQETKSADADLKAPCPVPRILDLDGHPQSIGTGSAHSQEWLQVSSSGIGRSCAGEQEGREPDFSFYCQLLLKQNN